MSTVCASAGTGQCRCPTVGDQSAVSSTKAGGSQHGYNGGEEGRTRGQEGHAGGRHEGPGLDEEVSHQQDNGDDYEDDGNEVLCSQDACPHCTYPYCTCPQDACNDAREEGGREVQFCKPH